MRLAGIPAPLNAVPNVHDSTSRGWGFVGSGTIKIPLFWFNPDADGIKKRLVKFGLHLSVSNSPAHNVGK